MLSENLQATAFGLDVRSEVPLVFLGRSAASPTGRPLDIAALAESRHELQWPESAELVCDERQPDGSVLFNIEADSDAGYLIWGPRYGAHLLSPQGTHLRCAPEGRREEAWQRLLIAQVLPFAALLQGLEIFHASAVALDGEAVAFLGPSQAGKTSIALELCRLGAGFLADDVLALETSGESLLAYPGTPLAGVATEQATSAVQSTGATAIASGEGREQMVRVAGPAEQVPLGSLFFIDRRPGHPGSVQFETVEDPQMLLTATFNFVLATPERLRGLLDVCALAASKRVERIVVGADVAAAELAAAVEQRLSQVA
jgi:hypothetical protein